jgi:NDP-sugar pyrophosphorylase family protein
MCTFSLLRFKNNPRFLSVEIDLEGNIIGLNINNKNNKEIVLLNGGVYLFSPNFIKKYKHIINSKEKLSLELEIFPMLMNNHERINSLTFEAPFVDIGIPKDYIRASNIIKNFQINLGKNKS